jgi:hypothetical protein
MGQQCRVLKEPPSLCCIQVPPLDSSSVMGEQRQGAGGGGGGHIGPTCDLNKLVEGVGEVSLFAVGGVYSPTLTRCTLAVL